MVLVTSVMSDSPSNESEQITCRHCETEIYLTPRGWAVEQPQEHPLWGPVSRTQCPRRPPSGGYLQPHQRRATEQP